MEKQIQAEKPISSVVYQSHQYALDPLAQQYYMQIKQYFSCRLDCEVEAELLTRQTFSTAAATLNQHRVNHVDKFLLSVAKELLCGRWLESGIQYGVISRQGIDRPFSGSRTEELQDQAAALYIKLRALQNNPSASAEVSATIYQWIGKDLQRQAAYKQARSALYRKERPQPARATVHPINPNIADTRTAPSETTPEFDQTANLGWPDVVLLVFAFLLLLPMIYFLAMPVGQ